MMRLDKLGKLCALYFKMLFTSDHCFCKNFPKKLKTIWGINLSKLAEKDHKKKG